MFRNRLLAGAMLAALLALVPAIAAADTELASSDPADGSTMREAPSEVVLTFGGEVAEDSGFTVTSPSGDEVGTGVLDLDVAERNILRGDVSVEERGEYVVAYSITGEDGHPIEGEVSFTFEPDGTVSPRVPNTAMAAPSSANALVLIGLALVGLAAVTTLRRFIRV